MQTRENRNTGRTTCPVPVCRPKIPHDLERNGALKSAVRNRLITYCTAISLLEFILKLSEVRKIVLFIQRTVM